MTTTLSDIARVAGVDRSTVCRVLRGQGRTSPETAARIKRLAAEMNYTPNSIARSLKVGRSDFVGVVADETVIMIFEKMIAPIEHRLHQRGFSMLFVSFQNSPDGAETAVNRLMRYNTAGLIVVQSSVGIETSAYSRYVESGGKLVVMNREISGFPSPQVVSSDYIPSRLAADHLVSLGHRRIAHLCIDSDTPSSRLRGKGFRDALIEAGLEVDESLIIPTETSHDAAKANTIALLHSANPPTGIVTRHDIVALGACDACITEGYRIPEDISITGVANVWNPSILRVPLTTVSYPFETMAASAADILIRMIEGENVPPQVLAMDPELVVRASTAKPRIVP